MVVEGRQSTRPRARTISRGRTAVAWGTVKTAEGAPTPHATRTRISHLLLGREAHGIQIVVLQQGQIRDAPRAQRLQSLRVDPEAPPIQPHLQMVARRLQHGHEPVDPIQNRGGRHDLL